MQTGSPRTTGKVTRLALVASVCVFVALAGCGRKDKGASQTAAKVNKEEITVHQINFALQQQRGLRPEQAEAASRQVLERLIDQELAVQRAEDLKLDRDPRVQQQLEAVRREVLARAYAEKISESAAKPSEEEVRKYYDDHPLLFKDRHVYSLQELLIEAKPEQVADLRAKMDASKSLNEFVEALKAAGVKFNASQGVRLPEQIPPPVLQRLSQLKEGQADFTPTPTGAMVLVLAGVRPQPVDFARARNAVEQLIVAERRRDLVTKDLKDLRAGAKIQYVGKFAEAAASAPAESTQEAAAPAAAPAIAPVEPASAPEAAQAPATEAAPASSAGSAALDASSISKGMGLK